MISLFEIYHHWLVVFIFVSLISTYLFYLYLKEHDKRKLMFSIALCLSLISYYGFTIGYIPIYVGETSILWHNIFKLTSLPVLYAIFFVVHEPFLKIKNYNKIFYTFLILSTLTFLLLLLPFKIETILFRQIISLELIAVVFYLYYKTKAIGNLYFLLHLFTLTVAGIGFRYDLEYFTAFGFLISYIFLTLVFINSDAKKEGIGSCFLLEQKLKTAEERYKQLFETVPDAVIVLAEDGAILDCNSAMADRFHADKEEIIGKNMHKLLPSDIDKNRTIIAQQALTTGRIQTNTDETNGLYTSNTYIPLKTNTKKKNLIIISKDITKNTILEKEKEEKIHDLQETELATLNIMEDMQETVENLRNAQKEISEKNEELYMMNEELQSTQDELRELNEDLEKKVSERTRKIRELLEQKDEFISQLGHDLKTPLTPLITLLPIIRQRQADKKSKELLDVGIKNIHYMKDLVIKTLQLARLNAPAAFLDTNDIQLSEQLAKTLEANKILLDQHTITIENNIETTLVVQADRTQLSELFENLLTNALKHTPKDGMITFDAQPQGEEILVSIKDTGLGMTKEQLSHIFDEFYKVDSSRHDLESSGLGLPICKRIVEKHGGKIWAESKGPGKGSTLYFTLKKSNHKKRKKKKTKKEVDKK